TFCEDHIVPEATIREIELCLAEALNNIIKHAYKGNEENIINILLEYSENKFKIVLEDTGIERANLDKPTLEFDPEDVDSLPEGGMGLFFFF
ncbi:MAG: ATP-binding protein, partial [Ignavibacteriae bacterium]|nr:ATP-binding protein [Ignavibacteriota bacterium]